MLAELQPFPEYDWHKHDLAMYKIYLFENENKTFVAASSNKTDLMAYLETLLLQANEQKNETVPSSFVDKVLEQNRVVSYNYRLYDRFHVFENLDTALFVLEDHLNEDLGGTIFIKQIFNGAAQWSMWVISK